MKITTLQLSQLLLLNPSTRKIKSMEDLTLFHGNANVQYNHVYIIKYIYTRHGQGIYVDLPNVRVGVHHGSHKSGAGSGHATDEY